MSDTPTLLTPAPIDPTENLAYQAIVAALARLTPTEQVIATLALTGQALSTAGPSPHDLVVSAWNAAAASNPRAERKKQLKLLWDLSMMKLRAIPEQKAALDLEQIAVMDTMEKIQAAQKALPGPGRPRGGATSPTTP